MTDPDANGWYPITEDSPPENTVFDVAVKRYDARLDQFLWRRFSDCVLVQGEIVAGVEVYGSTEPRPVKLLDLGYRPTHWRHIPDGPVDVAEPRHD